MQGKSQRKLKKQPPGARSAGKKTESVSRILDVYVALGERNLDAVGVERVVDGAQHVAHHVDLLHGVGPDEELQVDTAVAHGSHHRFHLLRGIDPLVFQPADGPDDQRDHLLQV